MSIDQYATRPPIQKGHIPENGNLTAHAYALSAASKGFNLKTVLSPFLPFTKSTPTLDPVSQNNAIPLLLFFVIIMVIILGSAGYFMTQLLNKWHSIEILHYQHEDEHKETPLRSVDTVIYQSHELKRSETAPEPIPFDSTIITLSKNILNRTAVGKCSGYIYSRRFGYLPSPDYEENKVVIKQVIEVHVNLIDPIFQQKHKLTWTLIQRRGFKCCCTVKGINTESLICQGTEVGENIAKAFQLQNDQKFMHAFLEYNTFVDCNIYPVEWSSGWDKKEGSLVDSNNRPTTVQQRSALVGSTHFLKIETQFIYPQIYANETMLQDLAFSLGDCIIMIY